MKKMCALALVLLIAASSLWGCTRRSGGYELLDVPKELHIDVPSLSEDTENLMSSAEETPLLAALPEKGVYVYAVDPAVAVGVLVKADGVLQYFPWQFSPQLAQPELYAADYDADGREDIAFTFVSTGGGTVHNENLHVLLRTAKGYKDNFYAFDKAVLETGRHLTVSTDGTGSFKANVDGRVLPFTLEGHGEFVDTYLREVVDFRLGSTISVRVMPGLVFRDEQYPVYDLMTYTAKIEFVDGILTQTNAQVTL